MATMPRLGSISSTSVQSPTRNSEDPTGEDSTACYEPTFRANTLPGLTPGNPAYDAARAMAGPGSAMMLGDGRQMALQQVAERSYRVYFGLVVPEGFLGTTMGPGPSADGTEATRGLLLSSPDFFASWPSQLRTFVEHAEGAFRPWPLYRIAVEDVGCRRHLSARASTAACTTASDCSTAYQGDYIVTWAASWPAASATNVCASCRRQFSTQRRALYCGGAAPKEPQEQETL